MRISIRQLKRIIKEQVEESTKGGSIYDDYEDSGREPSEREEPLRGMGGGLVVDDRMVAKVKKDILQLVSLEERPEVSDLIDELIELVESKTQEECNSDY